MADTTDTAAQIEALRAQIAELAGTVSELRAKLDEGQSDQEGGQSDQDPEPDFGKTDLSPLKPFDIQYFFGSGEWKIYLPEGCVMVDGRAARYADGTDSDEMAAITPAETLWAHVAAEGEGGYKFSIDDEAPSDDESADAYSFKVAGFDAESTQMMVQYVSGVVICGGGGWHAPGCWEPVPAEDGGQTPAPTEGGEAPRPAMRWANQYLMLGAELLVTDVNDDPAGHAGKFVAVCIEDANATDGGSTGSPVWVQEYNTAAALAAATHDATKFTVPLGKLNNDGTGYAVDMRFIPHAGAWDTYIAPAQSENGGAS